MNRQNPLYLSQVINENYYSSLNGLRGLAIIIVVVGHLHLTNNHIAGTLLNGSLGVSIFFVLSGFLITTLCLKELNLTGKLSLKNFYIRRLLRIFPVAYLYIFVIVLLNLLFNLGIPGFQFAGALFYVMDFSYFRAHSFSWMLGHFWSLSVEEQFYVLFPFILNRSFKLFFIAIIFVVFILPLLCSLQWFYSPLNHGIPYFFTHFFIKLQAIAVGCLFSILTFKKVFDHNWLNSTKVTGNIIAFFLIFYLEYSDFYSIKAVYINEFIAFFIGYIIISNIIPSKDIFFKILNTKILSFIGVLSYSLYIWQQIFTSNDAHLSKYVISFPFNLIWIIGVSCLSYFYYEKYFLGLKSKFSSLKNL